MPGSVESSELDGLRERAYGPHADILTDPIALARLHELEELVRAETNARAAALSGVPSSESGDRVETCADTPASRPTTEVSTAPPGENPPRGVSRVRVGVALGVAAVVAAVGAVTFVAASGGSSDPLADPGSTPSAAIPVVVDQNWSTSSASGYELFLDHLRGEVLKGPGMSELAPRLIRDELRPYGSLYGRTVWGGFDH